MTMPGITSTCISTDRTSLIVEWETGARTEFTSLWLRDNRADDRDRHSGQRLVDIVDVPARPRLLSVDTRDGALRIEWEGEPEIAVFDPGWLAARVAGRRGAAPERIPHPWLDGAARVATRDFAWSTPGELEVDRHARLVWLTRLLQTGMAFLSGVPTTNDGILDAMQLAGYVCETNYGLVFDVRSVPLPENLAYSDLGLGLHTDNPYREPVPGFQALHTLLASPDGGDSLFADGFALAEHLRTIDPAAFALLTRTPVPFAYRSRDAELYAERPFIQLACDGAIAAVHYNNRSIAPLPVMGRGAADFYAAYRRFAALLREPAFQLQFKLRDGDLVLFDNQRILHGRTAFSSTRSGRHLRGCYLTRDSVFGNTARLRRELQEGAAR